MICWRCGMTIDDNSIRCPQCGAQPPKSRRRTAAVQSAKDAEQARGSELPLSGEKDTEKSAAPKPRGSMGRMEAATGVLDAPPAGSRGRSQRPRDAAPTAQRGERAAPQASGGQVRMVRRHEYEAITPDTHGYDHFNWLRLCIFAVVCVVVLVAGAFFFLSRTMPGQRILAMNGREASASAYHEVGRQYMADGSISRAVWAMEIAQTKDPNNLEILIDLGRAYKAVNNEASAELAYVRAIHFWPDYPEPYRLLIDSMMEKSRNYEALQLADYAYKKTNEEYFETLYTQMLPAAPTVSHLGGERFTEEFSLTLSAEEGATIYYSTSSEVDPVQDGIEYTGPIYLAEGVRRIRAVACKDGMYSKEQSQTYVINKPTPDMPKATLSSGHYNSVRTVGLRAMNDDVIAIYYTIDGTAPTRDSKKYTEPIQLRIGKTQLRAIAENENGKLSNELVVEYECDGRTQTSMTDKDTIGDLHLYKTTQSDFVSKYGAPTAEVPDSEDVLGTYTRLEYAFGYAIFLDRDNGNEPVLVELSTSSTSFPGPRGTGIGSRMDDVIDSFRDEGGEENANGDRRLYSLRLEVGGRIGLMNKVSETEHTVRYFYQLENKQFVELSYYIRDGLVERMEWLQYDSY